MAVVLTVAVPWFIETDIPITETSGISINPTPTMKIMVEAIASPVDIFNVKF
jgi:hypothetical protein